MVRGWRLGIVVIGVVLQLAGLGLDAWLHARDATLAARESLVMASNPGHMLVAIGLALTVLGAGAHLLIPAPATAGPARRRAARPTSVLAALVVAGLVGGAFTVAATRGTRGGDDAAHEHAAPENHGAVPISWGQIREIDAMLAQAKAAAEKYRDMDVARADGYVPLTPPLYGAGSHWLNQELLDGGVFDVTRPQVLVYDYASGGGEELVGVGWALPQPPEDGPSSPFAPLATWHQHQFIGTCAGARGAELLIEIPLDEASCRAAGYIYFRDEPWLMHAWLFRPGVEGVFSHHNSTLR